MATITQSALGFGAKEVTEIELDGTLDTFAFAPNTRQILTLRNPTMSAITAVIKSDEPTTINVQGIGDVSISAGYSTPAIAKDEIYAIKLDSISGYLQGVISITGGTGLKATLVAY